MTEVKRDSVLTPSSIYEALIAQPCTGRIKLRTAYDPWTWLK